MKTIKKFIGMEEFETERLHALKLAETDYDHFRVMHSNEKVMATLGGVRSAEKTREYIKNNIAHWKENNFGLWMFYLKDSKEWIGTGGLRRVNINGVDEIEVAYGLMPAFWRKGYATEMAKACVEIAFEVLNLKNIICYTLPTNKISQSVMRKVGFEYECNVVVNYDGRDVPQVVYRLVN